MTPLLYPECFISYFPSVGRHLFPERGDGYKVWVGPFGSSDISHNWNDGIIRLQSAVPGMFIWWSALRSSPITACSSLSLIEKRCAIYHSYSALRTATESCNRQPSRYASLSHNGVFLNRLFMVENGQSRHPVCLFYLLFLSLKTEHVFNCVSSITAFWAIRCLFVWNCVH